MPGRSGGTLAHPELIAWHAATAAAAKAPQVQSPVVLKKPAITVSRFDGTIPREGEWHTIATDSSNTELGTQVNIKVLNGKLYIGLKYKDTDEGWTAADRRVL